MTADPSKYSTMVFTRLRGLQQCDGLLMPEDLKLNKPDEVTALQFLNDVWTQCGPECPALCQYA